MQDLAELERMEKALTEKLAQTRMSAMSAHSHNQAVRSGMSPFKPVVNQYAIQSTNKKSQQFLGDEDFNDRIEFGSSFKD